MARRVRCRICGRSHNWNEYKVCIRCRKNKKYTLEDEKTIEIEEVREKKEMKKDEKKEEDKVKVDRNAWIAELLKHLIERKVCFFTKDGTHTVGSVKEIKADFLILELTHKPYASPEAVEVISNHDSVGLENFKKYFLRLDDIVGFGEMIEG